jgi:hypothetical protein
LLFPLLPVRWPGQQKFIPLNAQGITPEHRQVCIPNVRLASVDRSLSDVRNRKKMPGDPSRWTLLSELIEIFAERPGFHKQSAPSHRPDGALSIDPYQKSSLME